MIASFIHVKKGNLKKFYVHSRKRIKLRVNKICVCILQGHSFRHDDRRGFNLPFRDSSPHPGWHGVGPELIWNSGLPVSYQRRPQAHTRKEVVHGAPSDHPTRRHTTFRINIHRNVSSTESFII